jgi:hypothetical protein
VEIACFKASGTFVPEGMISVAEDAGRAVTAGAAALEADVAAAVCAAEGCVEEAAGVCATAHPVINRAPKTRVHIDAHLTGMMSRSDL